MVYDGFFVFNLVYLIVGVFIWDDFKAEFFWAGTWSGVTEVLGIIFIQIACTRGLGGVAGAICHLDGPLTALVICFMTHRMLTPIEFLSLLISVFGGIVLVIPDQIAKIFCLGAPEKQVA